MKLYTCLAWNALNGMRVPLFQPVLFCFFLACPTGSQAQFNLAWNASYQHSTAANLSNEGRKVVVDASKNIYVLADVTSDKNQSGVVTGQTYYYTVLVKYGAGGAMSQEVIDVSSHFSAGFDQRSAFGLEIDGSNNIYIGYTHYNGTTDYDVRIAKYNSNLVQQWVYDYNPASIDSGICMTLTSAGHVIAVVKSELNGNIRTRILKTNAAGSTTTGWYEFNTAPDFVNAVTWDNNQYIYVTGYRIVSGYKAILTASIDNAGGFRWEAVFNGGSVSSDDIGRNLCIGADGDVYVTGTSDRATSNGLDIVVIKYLSGSGGKKWESYQNYNPNDAGFFVHAPTTQFVYAASVAGSNVIVDRLYAATGQLSRRNLYQPVPLSAHTSIGNVTLSDVIASSRPNFYLTGSVTAQNPSSQIFSCGYLVRVDFLNRGGSRVAYAVPVEGDFQDSYSGVGLSFTDDPNQITWVRNYTSSYASHSSEAVETRLYNLPTPVRQTGLPALDAGVSVYPNPATDYVMVTGQPSFDRIRLFNMAGQEVRSFINVSGNDLLDLSGLDQGLYTLQAVSAGRTIVKKLDIR